MNQNDWLAEQLEANRGYLQAVAYRILGSEQEAEDAVQAAWLKISQSNAEAIENLRAWLTTVVSRVCLDILRSRKSRPEEALEALAEEQVTSGKESSGPEHESLLADSVGLALLVVLDTLEPAERLVFVLHDIFDVPFGEIAPIVDRSEPAVRQIASRARRRVKAANQVHDAEMSQRRAVITAFLAAAREGRFQSLLEMLAPNAVFRSDAAAAAMGSAGEVRGADAVAQLFSGRAFGAKPALYHDTVGIVVPRGSGLMLILNVTITGGKIVEIEAVADPAQIQGLNYSILEQ